MWTEKPPTKPGRYGARDRKHDIIRLIRLVSGIRDELHVDYVNGTPVYMLTGLEWWPEPVVYPWERDKENG